LPTCQAKTLLVILNPISGYARSRQLPIRLRRRLEEEGFEAYFHITCGPDDAKRAASGAADRFDAIVVAGGDGTIREVIDGLAGRSVPLAILPTGTENLLAKELKVPSNNLEALIASLKGGRLQNLDLALANGRHFLMVSGVGFDAEVLHHLLRYRTSNITHLTYFWPIWRTFWEYAFPPISAWVDGEKLVDNQRGLLFVSNIRRYAVGLRICMQARCDDGLLDVCFYPCTHQIPLLLHAWRTVWGRHVRQGGAVYRQGRTVRVESNQRIAFQTDGDPAGFLPAQFSIRQHQVKILTPPQGFGRK